MHVSAPPSPEGVTGAGITDEVGAAVAVGVAVGAGFTSSDSFDSAEEQPINTDAIPSYLLAMLPYVATIVAVAGLVGKVRAPAADGEPYVKQ